METLVRLHLTFPPGAPVPPEHHPAPAFYRDKVRLFLRAEPEGVLVAERRGAVVGLLVVVTRPGQLRWVALRRGFALRAAARALAGGYGQAVRKLLVAGCSLFRRAGPAGAAEGAKVWVLLVHPEHRRAGVATALLEAAERYVRSRGLRGLTVTVGLDNQPAQALYLRAGFHPAGRCLESTGPSLILAKSLQVPVDSACGSPGEVAAGGPVRVALVITRLVPGGAQQVACSLFERLSRGASERGERFEPILITGPEGFESPGDARRGPVLVVRHLRREVRLLEDVLAVVELARLFRRYGVDLVHTHTSKAGVVGRLAARLAGVGAVVHTPHGHIYAPGARIQSVPHRQLLRTGFLWAERLAGRCGALLVTLTEAEARETVALGLAPADRVFCVPNGVEAEVFAQRPAVRRVRALRRELGLPARARVIISVGRLSRVKGHRVLVEALAELVCGEDGPLGRAGLEPAARGDLHLLLVGEGPERGALAKQARSLGVAQRVHFAGRRGREEVAALLHTAAVFVLPSYYEGFGIAVLEAQAAGLPVVASDVGGVREVLAGGRTGLLVPPGDARALAQAVGRVLGDRALARRLARRGQKRVAEEFAVERMVERYRAVYRRALGLAGEGGR